MNPGKIATILTGLLVGIPTGSVTINGQPKTLVLNTLRISEEELREIFAQFDLFTSKVASIGFIITGMVTY